MAGFVALWSVFRGSTTDASVEVLVRALLHVVNDRHKHGGDRLSIHEISDDEHGVAQIMFAQKRSRSA